jgi:flagellar motility protein MotE (MotC chaperone)
MSMRSSFFLALAAAVSLLAPMAYAQDTQSLGDVARQQRQQKEKSKTAHDQDKDKDAKASKVITNEEIPEHKAATPEATSDSGSSETTAHADSAAPSDGTKPPTEEDVKSQIQAGKGEIASLQKQIDETNESIKFAPANCVSGCEQWNERQKEKQQQVERMQAQLEELKKHLDEMQESARKQGLGSSVYEP